MITEQRGTIRKLHTAGSLNLALLLSPEKEVALCLALIDVLCSTHNPVFSPGESHGQKSLVGYSPLGLRVGRDRVTNTHNRNKFLNM